MPYIGTSHCIGCDNTYDVGHFHNEASLFCKDCVGGHYPDFIIAEWWEDLSRKSRLARWRRLRHDRALAGMPTVVTPEGAVST